MSAAGSGFSVERHALCDKAKKKGWTVISMENDWKRIFAFDQ